MRKVITISILAALVFSTSCATLFTGTRQKVTIDSNPQGAKVIIDGQKVGVTPANVRVDRELDALLEGGKEIRLEMLGYRESGYELDAELNAVSIFNFFNPLFWGIDIVTGAVTKYENYYNFELMPVQDNNPTIQANISGDKYDKLAKLKKLLDDGAITQEEYDREKAKILEE